MDAQGELEVGVAGAGELDQVAQGVGALAIANASVLDRAIAPPVADRGECLPRGRLLRHRPAVEGDRRQGGDPFAPAGRDRAIRPAERLPYGDAVRVQGDADVLAARSPGLVEAGIEIEEGAHGDRA